ncbi:hypothetical protein BAUCODRAFT_36936 [Baudoinia panamericana UAMH 10762]|uniref:Uncharacterized protein n=1 Tax=Baudoinia panamericana (strain UAMH 10762) TaxID=717646 RepID=M2N2R0_BAUPA|nr:uncharacterized protein BAUCODRAFT_36936 [Baudoinia panamericana UAMH 10762]EMC93264.1 hypothetical protein BAUCODRAFT_36936 [Baudoinia panamericana UAMH 10762]
MRRKGAQSSRPTGWKGCGIVIASMSEAAWGRSHSPARYHCRLTLRSVDAGAKIRAYLASDAESARSTNDD